MEIGRPLRRLMQLFVVLESLMIPILVVYPDKISRATHKNICKKNIPHSMKFKPELMRLSGKAPCLSVHKSL